MRFNAKNTPFFAPLSISFHIDLEGRIEMYMGDDDDVNDYFHDDDGGSDDDDDDDVPISNDVFFTLSLYTNLFRSEEYNGEKKRKER